MSQVVTIRISDASKVQLDRLSEFTKRTKSYLANEALEEYLTSKVWLMEALEQGIAAREQDALVDHETIIAEWEGKAGV